jgi:uncharacterized membrane protein YgcG
MRRLILVLMAVLAGTRAAAGQGDSIVIRDYRADVAVQANGMLDVTETIRFAFFGPWNGIKRDVSLQHVTAEGRKRKLDIDFSPPTDENGTPLRYETSSESWTKQLKIWVPDARDAERTVVIRYRVGNGLRFFDAESKAGALDELYWNVTGNGWTMPIDRAEARITLPSGVAPKQAAAYTGYAGSTGSDAAVNIQANGVTVTTTRRLESTEGLTVGVGWAPGVVTRPDPSAETARELFRGWPLGLPLVAFFLSLRMWRRKGRDPEEREIVVGYEPPEGMTPAELGTIVDHTVDMRDITATLVDLAVRGYIGIEERKEKKMLGLFSSTEYVFHLRRPRDQWSELAAHERSFLSALFTSAAMADSPWEVIRSMMDEARPANIPTVDANVIAMPTAVGSAPPLESVALSQLQNRFYKSLPGIHDAVYDALIRRGHYKQRPDKVKGAWIGISIVLLIGSIIAGVTLADAEPAWINGGALAVGGAVAAIVVFVFGMVMPARTESGARAREAALGFKEFLDKVESDRFKRMITSPELFERFLPHAMAFGVEDKWAHAFDDLLTEPPDWYSGSSMHGFRASSFTSNMSALTTQAGSTMSSSPSSSGSGGGGSSGGGSGGGGGSGF